MPFIIAQEKGFFLEEGLDATIRAYPSGKEAIEAMFAEEVDSATLTETPIVFSSLMRDDFAVFATFAYSYDNMKVIGRKDRGVGKPADLKGKKIGFAARTSSHFFVQAYLAEQRIDTGAVGATRVPVVAGELTIQLVKEGASHITLTVSDNGIGLPEHVDFRQSPSLGLTLVNSLVEQLNGTIELDRSRGTTFTIMFG